MIGKIQQYYEKSNTNKYVVLGALILILGLPFGYFLISKGTGIESVKSEDQGLTLESDKSFDDIRSSYYNDGRNTAKKSIESEDDFFAVEKHLDSLQGSMKKEAFYENSETSEEMVKLQEAIQMQKKKAEASTRRSNGKGDSASSGANYNNSGSGSNTNYNGTSSGTTRLTKKEKEEMEYERLAKMKVFMLDNSQDYNRKSKVSNSNHSNKNEAVFEAIKVRAAIYKNQLIIPGERVRLILTEPLVIQGKLFEKNTLIYAMTNINESRVLLDIKNINGVTVDLMVKDINDQMQGLYSKKAGALWERYEKEQNNAAVDGAIKEINTGIPILNTSLQAIGGFFKGKKIKKSDKILLINDHEVILTNKE